MSLHRRIKFQQKGFTLIELALVVLIIGLLASVAIPSYSDYVQKSQLVEVQLQVDALRNAATALYESSDEQVRLKFKSQAGGSLALIKNYLPNLPFQGTNYAYPNLNFMFVMRGFSGSNTDIRPYIGLTGSGVDGRRTLRLFSEIYPASRQEWMLQSTMLLIPMIDENVLAL